jgi:hypothetical protein
MNLLKFILFFFILITFMGVILATSIIEHEHLHQKIFADYGINSTIEYYFWDAIKAQLNPLTFFDTEVYVRHPFGITYADENSTGNCNETCEMLHTQLEIVDHGVMNIIMTLFLFLVVYLFYHEFLKTKEKEKEYEYIYISEDRSDNHRSDSSLNSPLYLPKSLLFLIL